MVMRQLERFHSLCFCEVLSQYCSGVSHVEGIYFAVSDQDDESSGTAELGFLHMVVQDVGIGLLKYLPDNGLDGQDGVLVLDLFGVLLQEFLVGWMVTFED